ncbi:E3 ubiquitin-protein ligase dcst1 [Clonorchis sinensis]|uniref:E3 ubiquitin-protein ligase dcst1 n=2 Tax=Clonorchis sinensis TaxID=79923 RepID=A0A3R7GRI5_CLOSI|nr:E3 ubiquitin-protein ligase dcst1 [Clonorchis sinensis]
MWHQHLCLIGITTGSLLFIEAWMLNRIQLPSWLEPDIPDLRLEISRRIRAHVKQKAVRQLIGSSVCITYWTGAYLISLFPLKLKPRLYRICAIAGFFTWHFVIQPYLFASLFYSIYVMFLVLDDAALLKDNLQDQWTNALNHLRRNNTPTDKVLLYTGYLENLQRTFRCCGALSLSDWDGADPLREGLNSTWFSHKHGFYPWQSTVVYIPPSCCDPERTSTCSQVDLLEYHWELVDRPQHSYSQRVPVHFNGCVEVMTELIGAELTGTLIQVFLINIALHVLQTSVCYCAWYVRKPRASLHSSSVSLDRNQSAAVNEDKDFLPVANNDDVISEEEEEEDDDDDEEKEVVGLESLVQLEEETPITVNEGETLIPVSEAKNGQDLLDKHKLFQARKITVGPKPIRPFPLFHGKLGYISNKKLMLACQGMAIYGRLSLIQHAFRKTKARWIEKGIRIGWCLRDRDDIYATFLRPIRWSTSHCPGQVEWSGLRHWLRRRLPLVEAILYADGNVRREVEGNAIYRCFTICLVRMICCAALGYLVSITLVKAFVPPSEDEPPVGPKKSKREEQDQKDAFIVTKEVTWMTSLLIQTTIVLGAVVSRRVRCLLFMLVPSLGLTVGKSYLGAEVLHTVLTGPTSTTEKNLRSAAETLECLIKLSANLTREAKTFYEDAKENLETESTQNYYELVQEKSTKLTESIDSYKESADKLMQEIAKSEEFARRAEETLRGGSKEEGQGTGHEGVDKVDEARRNRLLEMTQKMVDRDGNATVLTMQRSKDKMKKMLSKIASGPEMFENLSRRLEAGADIERLIKRRMTATCMVFHNTRGRICSMAAVHTCDRLQTVLSLILLYPVLIKYPCIWQVAKGVACPTNEAIDAAVEQCGSSGSNIGMGPGFGAMFYQSVESLNQLRETFHMQIRVGLDKLPNMLDVFSSKQSAALEVAQKTRQAVTILLQMGLLASTLLKLLALVVFRKANMYITKYLSDLDFDNVYIGKSFEAIDAKRVKENREVLLPLKSQERKTVFWRRKAYTKSELSKAFVAGLKSFGFGAVLCVMFLIDRFIFETIGLLDEVTSASVEVGKKQSASETREQGDPEPPTIEGDGIFRELIMNTIIILTKISKIDLDFDLGACSPRVQVTSQYYTYRFVVLWVCMLIVGFFSGYLLRLRHIIMDFFYPFRQRRRAIHLYNRLLVNRRRHLTICRNLLVHHTRQNRLQSEAREKSSAISLYEKNPRLAKFLGQNKVTCILCLDRYKIGPSVVICPYDDAAMCLTCKASVFPDTNTCVICLDRDVIKLFEERRRVLNVKRECIANLDESEVETEVESLAGTEDDQTNEKRSTDSQQDVKYRTQSFGKKDV